MGNLLAAVHAVVSIAEQPSEDAVLDRLLAAARELLGAAHGAVRMSAPDGTSAARARSGLTAAQVAALPPLPAGDTIRLPGDDGRPHPLLGVPLVLGGCTAGALYLCRAAGEPAFTAPDESAAAALARQAATALVALRRASAATSTLAQLATEPGPQAGAAVERMLATARSVLGMELAYLARLDGDSQTVTHVDADGGGGGAPAVRRGAELPLRESYCRRMVAGEIANSVPDVRADPVLGPLPVTSALGIGAYCGVPVHLPDGTLYGALCTVSGRSGPPVSAGQLEALRILAGLVAVRIAEEREDDRLRAARRAQVLALADGAGRTVVVQPVVDLATGAAVGFEALSRFVGGSGGPQPADRVFAEAAGLGLGVALELAAARSALELVPRLPDETYLAVNLSPHALLDPQTVSVLSDAPLDRVVLELTEHEQVGDYAGLLRVLSGLRGRGLRLAVDDAGAGFASLQHVVRLAPDVIKLDAAFTRGVESDPSRRAVSATMVRFAQELRAGLVAEGIETPAELATLRALGVPQGQGYLLARPAQPDGLLGTADGLPSTARAAVAARPPRGRPAGAP